MNASRTKPIDSVRLIKTLKAKVEEAGGSTAFADKHKITKTLVNDTLRGAKPPGPAILKALGLKKIVRYAQTGRRA